MNYRMLEWTDENIKKFWDYESNFEDRYFTYQVGDRIVESFHDMLQRSNNVLDFGCGAGLLISHLLEKGIDNIYGVDFSEESVDKVNKKFHSYSNFKGAYTLEEILKKQEE